MGWCINGTSSWDKDSLCSASRAEVSVCQGSDHADLIVATNRGAVNQIEHGTVRCRIRLVYSFFLLGL